MRFELRGRHGGLSQAHPSIIGGDLAVQKDLLVGLAKPVDCELDEDSILEAPSAQRNDLCVGAAGHSHESVDEASMELRRHGCPGRVGGQIVE